MNPHSRIACLVPLNAGERRLNLITVFLCGSIIVFLSASHAVWRDEVRALSIAIGSGSLVELFRNLHNEGHPALWYLLLYAGYGVAHNTVILKAINVVIAIAAISVFLWKAPFPWTQRVLFVFGYFPLYEYSVLNRSYGLSMLLIFLVCSLYEMRFEKIGLFSLSLVLLANTNPHSLVIVAAIELSLVVEIIVTGRVSRCGLGERVKILGGVLAVAVGMLLAVAQVYPEQITLVTKMFSLHWDIVPNVLVESIVFPGNSFPRVFGIVSAVITSMILWLAYLCLVRRPFVLMILLFGTIGLGMLSSLVYQAGLRHQGFVYLLLIAAFWLYSLEEIQEQSTGIVRDRVFRFLEMARNLLLYGLLIFQVLRVGPAIAAEVSDGYSSSKDFGIYLRAYPYLQNAIIIGEPDYFMESLPYYVDNAIYIPREQRFGKTVQFTTANARSLSLGDLLGIAERLRNKFNRPVLIVIGHTLGSDGPYERTFSYQKVFTYSKKSLAQLRTHTTKIAEFHQALSNENYDVFLLG